jgi:excisionase family DNA binding protein
MPSLLTRRDRQVEPSGRRFALGEWMNAPEWISIKQAVDLSGYNAEYIRRMMRIGKIRADKLEGGREWLIDKASLQAYVKEMKSLGTDKHNPHRNGN